METHFPRIDLIFARCEGAYSAVTLRGYRSDLEQFARWCSERDLGFLPASAEAVASFVDDQAVDRSIATLKRRIAAIQFIHRIADLPSPVAHSSVQLAIRRAARAKTRRPKQVLGLTVELLDRMVEACPESLAGTRDAALLSVGYDSLCRSSELSAMRVEHLAADLSTVQVPRSKSDPFGDGRLAYLSPRTKELLASWIDATGLIEGPLFRSLHTRKVSAGALDTSSIRKIVKRAAKRAEVGREVTLGLSGHSMRVGAAQDMMGAGIDALAIMQAGGWRTYAVLARYVENTAGSQIHVRRWQHLSTRAT